MKVIKIGAEWCPQCKMLDKKFEGFDACELTTYDAEENEDIVEKYGIRNIPATILLDDNENVIHRWAGLFDINEINEKIKEINNG